MATNTSNIGGINPRLKITGRNVTPYCVALTVASSNLYDSDNDDDREFFSRISAASTTWQAISEELKAA